MPNLLPVFLCRMFHAQFIFGELSAGRTCTPSSFATEVLSNRSYGEPVSAKIRIGCDTFLAQNRRYLRELASLRKTSSLESFVLIPSAYPIPCTRELHFTTVSLISALNWFKHSSRCALLPCKLISPNQDSFWVDCTINLPLLLLRLWIYLVIGRSELFAEMPESDAPILTCNFKVK